MLIASLKKYKYQLIIALVVFVAIWPISFYIYLPKWDNIDCYLPYKYFWSEAIWRGEWPWWNPYQYLGLPAYSDMQNGMFNPITWLVVGVFGPYTTLASATEFTIYFLIAGFGMWRLTNLFFIHAHVRLILAISFALSGFMVGTSQILIFLMGAAWLPWVWFELMQVFNHFRLKNTLMLGAFISLHITSASPAYSIILIYLVFGFFIFQTFIKKVSIKHSISYLTIAALVSILTALPFILGFYDFQPYFGRLGKLPYTSWIYEGSFDWWEYTSFVFPLPTISQSDVWGPTDLTLRNGYMGIFTVVALFIALYQIKNHSAIKIKLLALCILFLILAAGDYTFLYKWFYHLPGFGTFRHPSFFRAYFIFFALLLSGYGFEYLFQKPKLFKKIATALIFLIVFVSIVALIYQPTIQLTSFFKQTLQLSSKNNFEFSTLLIFNAIILVAILGFSLNLKHKSKIIVALVVVDLIIHAQLFAPYTLANTKVTQNHMSSYFNDLPLSINQAPTTTALNKVNPKVISFDKTPIWRNKGTFTKTITPQGHNATQFKNFNVIENNEGLNNVVKNPLFFTGQHFVNDATVAIKPNTVWGHNKVANYTKNMIITQSLIGDNMFSATVQNPSDSLGLLVLNQNFHHNWTVSVNNQQQKPFLINDALMGINIPAKYNADVTFSFSAPLIKTALIISIVTWILLLGMVLITGKKSPSVQ